MKIAFRTLTVILLSLPLALSAEEDDWQEILLAQATYGDLDLIKQALAKGANINGRKSPDNDTVLMIASNNAELLRFFISKGANVNLQNDKGETALMRTSEPECVQILLKAGAKVDTRDKDGTTALMNAAFLKNTDIMRILIQKGAQVDARNENGETALLLAKSPSAADLLLANKADMKAVDKYGQNALHLAHSLEMVKYWVGKKFDINAKSTTLKRTILISAAVSGEPENVEIVRYLVGLKANVNERDLSGKTALQLAREKHAEYSSTLTDWAANYQKTIDILVKAGAK